MSCAQLVVIGDLLGKLAPGDQQLQLVPVDIRTPSVTSSQPVKGREALSFSERELSFVETYSRFCIDIQSMPCLRCFPVHAARLKAAL